MFFRNDNNNVWWRRSPTLEPGYRWSYMPYVTSVRTPLDDGYGSVSVYQFDEKQQSTLQQGTSVCMLHLRRCWQLVTSPVLRRRRRQDVWIYRSLVVLAVLVAMLLIAAVVASLTAPYTSPPAHYHTLRKHAQESTESGRVNLHNERVFIAAVLHDPEGKLVGGSWGRNVLSLVDLLGPENTFLSIYESDSGEEAGKVLYDFKRKVSCPHEIVAEQTLPLDDIQVFELPDGDRAVKRISYLAAARNRALEPLNHATSNASERYDRILYLNDVVFDPVEAAQLLFATNVNEESSRAEYAAACAIDFHNPFIYYDTFATRDMEGYSLGVPLYPWFTGEGQAESRRDVLHGLDHVRVKSCWGGMFAADARIFQPSSGARLGDVVRFRDEVELDWEYSECCLIHADIQIRHALSAAADESLQSGIYMNPFIRTAYSERTFSWLGSVRHVERLFFPIQVIIDIAYRLPFWNERRAMIANQPVWKNIWNAQNGSNELLSAANWERKLLPADPGSFCGIKATSIRRLEQSRNTTGLWETIKKENLPTIVRVEEPSQTHTFAVDRGLYQKEADEISQDWIVVE